MTMAVLKPICGMSSETMDPAPTICAIM